jgi:YbbR domain-containing protein
MKRILLLATLVFMQLSMFSQNTDWYNEIDMDPYDSNIVNIPTDVIYDDSGAMWTSYSGDTYGSISKYKDNIFTIFCAD